MPSFRVQEIGEAARRALAPGQLARVLAVFSRTFYCESENRALVCIGPPGIGAGPLNALVPLPDGLEWSALGLCPGAPASTDGRTLRVNGQLLFDLRSARPWRPVPLPHPVDGPLLTAGLAALTEALGGRPRPDGLGPLIAPLAAIPADLPPDLPDGSPLVRTAWRGVRPLMGWLGLVIDDPARPAAPPPAETEGLIGLGPGLTPAGDDFLGGMLIALHALGAHAAAGGLGTWLLARAGDRTHRISLGHLACAADGEGAGALHEALAAISSPGSPGLGRCLEALGQIGHSSGWDALAGVVAATRAVIMRTGGPELRAAPLLPQAM
jgi:hypothetical protein